MTDPAFFEVRPARLHDVPAILELWLQARSAHASTVDRPQDVQRLLSETPGGLLVADASGAIASGAITSGAIVGVLIAAWDGWRGNMYRLAVDREHRRRGVGLALVRAGEEHLRRRGAHRVTALVGYADEVAGAFWDRAGYPQDREIGRRARNLT